jgi:hypothetical protein
MPRERAVTDDQYKEILLKELGIEDPADANRNCNIATLEEMILNLGGELPLVRRITPATTVIDSEGKAFDIGG